MVNRGCITFPARRCQYKASISHLVISSAGRSVSDSSGALVRHPAQETSASCGEQLWWSRLSLQVCSDVRGAVPSATTSLLDSSYILLHHIKGTATLEYIEIANHKKKKQCKVWLPNQVQRHHQAGRHCFMCTKKKGTIIHCNNRQYS